MSLKLVKKELNGLASSEKSKVLSGFFKTGKGQYGEGDIFLGVMVPQQRQVAKKFKNLSFNNIEQLLKSKVHEQRLTALFILVNQFENADDKEKLKIYKMYLKNAKFVNNWDLVDLSAPQIVGKYLLNKERKVLYKLARSNNLWEKRIAIVATFTFIRNNQFNDTISISEMLLNDKHDLIHKSVGWMLREVGKRDQTIEEKFLKKYHKVMPRTMLRYAIEKFSDEKRKYYMKK